jgi:hypothetical protein
VGGRGLFFYCVLQFSEENRVLIELTINTILSSFLLSAYNSCTGGYIVIVIYVLAIYLRTAPSIISLFPSPFLEQFQQVSFYFYIWIQNISIIFTLTLSLMLSPHLTLVPTSGKDLLYLPVPSFFKKCILTVQGGFYLDISDMSVSYIKISLTPITYSFSITMLSYYSTAFSALHYIIFIYR